MFKIVQVCNISNITYLWYEHQRNHHSGSNKTRNTSDNRKQIDIGSEGETADGIDNKSYA